MRRVWAAVASVWVLLALVAIFAWSRPAPVTASQQTIVAVKGAKGATKYVVATVPGGAVHTTTHTSAVALP